MIDRLHTLEPGSQRYQVLERAIEFKRSWVDLARSLAEVCKDGSFKEWGYRTFEAYAQHELHLKRETAQKLVRSYEFLNTHERSQLDAAERHSANQQFGVLPDFRALDVLAEARSNPYLAEEDYREIRDQVFLEDAAPGAVRKLVRERAPEPAKKQTSSDSSERLRKCLALAERLYGMLLEEDVPEGVSRSVEQAIGGLRRLIEE